MKNKKFRKALDSYVEEMEIEEDVILLDDHAYDKSIVGITDNGILVYDFNKMVEELMNDEGWDELEAIEWLEYNTLPALSYMGDRRPIIINETVKTIMERY